MGLRFLGLLLGTFSPLFFHPLSAICTQNNTTQNKRNTEQKHRTNGTQTRAQERGKCGGGVKTYKEEGRDGIQKERKTSREEKTMILTTRRQITSNIYIRQENVYFFNIKVS